MKAPLTAIVVGSLLAAAGCGGGGDSKEAAGTKPAASEGASVTVKVFNFQPDPLEIEAGTKVTWTNRDSTLHNVVGKGYKGDLPESGGTYSRTFEKPGTYAYICSLHSGPGMRAKIVVR